MSDFFVRLSLFSEASAEEPVQVEATILQPDQAATHAREINVGVIPVWGIAVGWVFAIVMVSQAVKYFAHAVRLQDRLGAESWRRWMYVVPIVVGTLLSALFGPQLGVLFGLKFGLAASILILGPGSGAAAAFAYDGFRAVVLPVLPTVVISTIERITKIELPEPAFESTDHGLTISRTGGNPPPDNEAGPLPSNNEVKS